MTLDLCANVIYVKLNFRLHKQAIAGIYIRMRFILLGLIILTSLGGCKNNAPATACTADVKECPDGSFVARDPERNCEFKECPGPTH